MILPLVPIRSGLHPKQTSPNGASPCFAPLTDVREVPVLLGAQDRLNFMRAEAGDL